MSLADFFFNEFISGVILFTIIYTLNKFATEYASSQVGLYFIVMLLVMLGFSTIEGVVTLKLGLKYYITYAFAQILLVTKGVVGLLDFLVGVIFIPLLYFVFYR